MGLDTMVNLQDRPTDKDNKAMNILKNFAVRLQSLPKRKGFGIRSVRERKTGRS